MYIRQNVLVTILLHLSLPPPHTSQCAFRQALQWPYSIGCGPRRSPRGTCTWRTQTSTPAASNGAPSPFTLVCVGMGVCGCGCVYEGVGVF